MPGSGKSVVAQRFGLMGLPTIRFGQIIIDEVRRRGLEVNPSNEQIVREDLRANFGMDVCARLSLPVIQSSQKTSSIVVVDGLYSWAEYKTLRAELGQKLFVVAVVSSRNIRYGRLRTRPVRPLVSGEAERRDVAEIEKLEKGGPIAIADRFILNDDTEEQLFERVDNLYREVLTAVTG
jgi:dephospho-CoA kinase